MIQKPGEERHCAGSKVTPILIRNGEKIRETVARFCGLEVESRAMVGANGQPSDS